MELTVTGHPAGTLTADPVTGTEMIFAEVLADLLHVEQVSVDSHFFDDLGADSLVMAHFCARVRKRPDLPSVSIKDIYRNPTLRSLEAALAPAEPAAPAAPVGAAEGVSSSAAEMPTVVLAKPAAPAEVAAPARTREYLVCGALQLLFFLGYAWAVALVGARAYAWISAGSGLRDIYLRSVLFGGVGFTVVCTIPILAKWLLIGRWKPRQIRIWSLTYLRFWIVKTLVRSNPLAFLTTGSPLYVLYLRALGAKIGPGTVIFSHNVPVCTDLLTIGADSVIRKDAFFGCYRAHQGWIQTGPVTLGRKVFIGEKSVLDINTSMGDVTQLGHASSLHSGQQVPVGERWHGSPAQRTDVNYLRVTSEGRRGTLRRFKFSAVTLFYIFFVYLPLAEGGAFLLLTAVPAFGKVLDPNVGALTSRKLYADALALSFVTVFGLMLAGLIIVAAVPRLLNLFIKPCTVYPLYGFRDRIHRAVARITGVKFFTHLFGDSSFIVYYLRWIGYDLCEVEKTGSNFGMEVAHETRFLSTIGSGTMVADGLSIINADFSSTSFRLSPVYIGPDNFLGNDIVYPAGGRTGHNCLLATKTMIPLDGEVREGVGLLGSPSFEIPRSVERDSRFDHLSTGDELRWRLIAKNWYNLRSMGVFLVVRWLHVFLITVFALAAFDSYGGFAQLQMAVLFAVSVLVTPVYFVLVERGMKGFLRLQPKYCSIYDPYFWRIERLWKVPSETYLHMFNCTPFKNVIWRALGVRIGKRVFDDGCSLTERTLATIGDDCTLNFGSEVQCHSQEDGTFKSDRSTIGDGCTIGVGALVHYGVTMGEGSVLAPDSFLMKGEEIPPHARWGGNPAREM